MYFNGVQNPFKKNETGREDLVINIVKSFIMLKNLKKVSILFSATAILASCSVTSYSSRVAPITESFKATPVIVDLELDLSKKIEHEAKAKSVSQAKSKAYYEAIKQNKVDVIVDPIYEIKSTKIFFANSAIAKITGYGATYKNPRSAVDVMSKELSKIDPEAGTNYMILYGSSNGGRSLSGGGLLGKFKNKLGK